jgi:fatty-acyl-CoA synthase
MLAPGGTHGAALARADGGEPPEVAHPEDGLIIICTSGTTGLPKGAVICQRAEIMRAMLQRIEPVPVAADDGFVACSPMFHPSGTDHTIAAPIRGGKVVVMDGFDAEALCEVAAGERIAHLTVLRGVVDRVAEVRRAAGVRPLGVRTVGVVPARLSKLQSSHGAIRLSDEDDIPAPDGEPGEIGDRGPTLLSGCWRAPEVGADVLRGGWCHSGDVLGRNPDGSLDFVDRRTSLVNSGGESIHPAGIERVPIALPGVADVAVIRKPDPVCGEVPVACIVPRAGETLTAEMAIAACRDQIARYKVPKEVRFIAESGLRRSASGKIIRGDREARLRRETETAAAAATAAPP